MDWYALYQAVLMRVCLGALIVGMVALFLAKVFAPVWEELRKFASLPLIERCLLAFCVCGLSYYGATKHAVSVRWDLSG